MLNDPLANALSLMKNAEIKGKGTCTIQPSSKLIGGVLTLLKEKGYVGEFEHVDDGKAGVFQVKLIGNINNLAFSFARWTTTKAKITWTFSTV